MAGWKGWAVEAMEPGSVIHKGMIPADKAVELVLGGAGPTGVEDVALIEAAGRVLAAPLKALRTQPPFPASAMDGYAVRQADLANLPARVTVAGTAAAGHPFTGEAGPGQCVRIFTGAPVPEGLDTIVIQENGERDGDDLIIAAPQPAGRFIRGAGLDFAEGEVLLGEGDVLDPARLSLAAAMGHGRLPVYRRPVVAIAATGDELVLPGSDLKPGQIIASNTFGLQAIAEASGAKVIDLGILADTAEAHESAFQGAFAAGADLLVTTGGASVGDHDLVRPVMASMGFTFAFEKVAMRPGKPAVFGTGIIGDGMRRFLGLPGNPVSSLVTAHLMMRPLIRLLAGYPPKAAQPVPAILGKALGANDERQDHLRATATRGEDGALVATAFDRQDSSMLATFARADCLIVRPAHAPAAVAGSAVEVLLLRDI